MEKQQKIEEMYVEETINIAQKQLAQAQKAIAENQSEMIALKQEIRDCTAHSASNLSSADGFENLVTLSQSMAPVTNIAAECGQLTQKIKRLELIIDSPYFAISFQEG